MLDGQLKKPGKITSYLTSFKKFLGLVNNARYSRFAPPLKEQDKVTFKYVKPEIKGWHSTVDSETQDIKNQRYLDKTEGLLTVHELKMLKTSKPFTAGEKVLVQVADGKQLTQLEFTTARDMIIARFAIESATRSGPLYNATLTDYRAADTLEGVKVMLVAKQKRAKDGPAILPMLPELQQYMETYVNIIRPKFAAKDEQKLFINTERKGFSGGNNWKKALQPLQKGRAATGRSFCPCRHAKDGINQVHGIGLS